MAGAAVVTRFGDEARLWRAVDVYRGAALAYAVVSFAWVSGRYARPWLGWLVLGLMAGWTALLAARRVPSSTLIAADLAVGAVAVLVTRVADDPARIASGTQTLPTMWSAAPVLGWAVWRGRRAGLAAAAVISLADVAERGFRPSTTTVYNIVVVLLAGSVVGYAVEIFRAGRRSLARAVAVDAASRERERLAADIHDSVLQVLAFVQRRSAELGGETAELGRMAGEQEARLRALVAGGGPAVTAEGAVRGEAGDRDVRDVRAWLSGLSSSAITVSGPAGPVPLPPDQAQALVAATAAALDNVRRHAGPGAHAWILLEDEAAAVVVTVRDDGPGVAPGRLDEAERLGRLGVAASIRGRITAVGGQATVTSVPGQGTEVELRVPRREP